MTENIDIPRLSRPTFFSGQRLTADDLNEIERVRRELRWLHNRSLHSWGIGIGFDVTGERGDSSVEIREGYGIDCLGREVLATQPLTLPVPAVAGSSGGEAVYFLVAAYRDDSKQDIAERRDGICLPRGSVRLTEEPTIEWRRKDQLKEGHELVLAQVSIQNCRLSKAVSTAVRRYARPASHPYIASGQTQVDGTLWQAWLAEDDGRAIGVYVDVDASSARFQSTPRYSAHVIGQRYWSDDSGGNFAVGFTAVSNSTPDGFRCQVLFPEMEGDFNPPSLQDGTLVADLVRSELRWHVAWLGVAT